MKKLLTLLTILALSSNCFAQEKVSQLPAATSIVNNGLYYYVAPGSPPQSQSATALLTKQFIYAGISGNLTINSGGVATIGNGQVTNSMIVAGVDAAKIANGTVSNTVFPYLANVTSDIQTQLNALQTKLNGTGFVKATGTTISYDNSTYLTTSSAASTYVPQTTTVNGQALSGNVTITNITGNAGTVSTINSLLSQGTNITITGSGTSGSPYVISATSGGSPAFNTLTSGTNTAAVMVVGSGSSIAPSGTGTVQATNIASTITAGTNISISGSGTTSSPYNISATGTTSTAFNNISGATNTTAAMVVGSGASIAPTGTGTIQATNIGSTISAGTGISFSGVGTVASPYVVTNSGGTVTGISIASANGFTGISDGNAITPTLTLKTSVTGLLKGNGTAISAATSGTDYAPATTGTSILKANSGGFTNAVAGTDYVAPGTATNFTAQQNFGVATLSSSSNSTSWNLATAQEATESATENTTLQNPTNQVAGGTYQFTWVQNASTAYTLAFGTNYIFSGSSTVSATLSSVAVFSCVSDGTKMRCVMTQFGS